MNTPQPWRINARLKAKRLEMECEACRRAYVGAVETSQSLGMELAKLEQNLDEFRRSIGDRMYIEARQKRIADSEAEIAMLHSQIDDARTLIVELAAKHATASTMAAKAKRVMQTLEQRVIGG